MGASSWERLPAASSCFFLSQQQELAPMGRSYREKKDQELAAGSRSHKNSLPQLASRMPPCAFVAAWAKMNFRHCPPEASRARFPEACTLDIQQ